MSVDGQHAPGHDVAPIGHTGTEVINGFENPGMPPHAPRQTDLHPEKERRVEGQVVW